MRITVFVLALVLVSSVVAATSAEREHARPSPRSEFLAAHVTLDTLVGRERRDALTLPEAASRRGETVTRATEEVNRYLVTFKAPEDVPAIAQHVERMTVDERRLFERAIGNAVTRSFPQTVRHRYSSFDAAALTLTQQELDELIASGLVESVTPDEIVTTFLQDSVPLINADDVWSFTPSGITLTGIGETVCVIDTGVAYNHVDLGACSLSAVENKTPEAYNLTSPGYPAEYGNDLALEWTITKPGYASIAVHFDDINLENGWDDVCIGTTSNVLVWCYTGNATNEWSPSVPGDALKVFFFSDEINEGGPYRGFSINATADFASLTADWSACPVVIGGIDFVNGDADPMDDDGHGTHVAGTIAANGGRIGVAPNASIVAVKALSAEGTGWSSDIVAGIDYCVTNADALNISVISMSLGGSSFTSTCDAQRPTYANAINAANALNISVVVATGNNGYTTQISAPACISNAIRVGATTKADVMAGYSNRNALVKLVAPGSNINAPWYTGAYVTISGTSMATPHVSGAIALMNQYLRLTNRTRTPQELETILATTGVTVYDAGSNRNYSRSNVLAAVLALDETAPVTSTANLSAWQSEPFTIMLNATDDLLFGHLIFTWNNITTNTTNSTVFIAVEEDGNHSIMFYAVDAVGNEEVLQTSYALLDTEEPQVYSITAPSYSRSDADIVIIVNATDATMVSVTVNDVALSLHDELYTVTTTPTLLGCTPDTVCTLAVNATDLAGKSNTTTNTTIIVDDTAPTLTYLSPVANETWHQSWNLTFTVTTTDELGSLLSIAPCLTPTNDSNTTTCFDGFVNVSANGTHEINLSPIDTLLQGSFLGNLTFQATDETGNTNRSTTQTILFIDRVNPTITITLPSNNTFTNQSSVNVSLHVHDDVATTLAYTLFLNDSANESDTTPQGTVNLSLENLNEGTYVLVAYAEDVSGRGTNSSSILVTVDLTPPNQTAFTANSIGTVSATLTLTTNEPSTCRYSAVNESYADMTALFTTTGGTSHSVVLSGLASSTSYTRYAHCIDRAGNTAETTSVITFTTAAPIVSSGGGGGGGAAAPSETTSPTTVSVVELPPASQNTAASVTVVRGSAYGFSVRGSSHTVRIAAIGTDAVTFTFSSEPVNVTLRVGEERDVDLDGDGAPDVRARLESFTGFTASLSLQELVARVPEELVLVLTEEAVLEVDATVDEGSIDHEDSSLTVALISDEHPETAKSAPVFLFSVLVILAVGGYAGYRYKYSHNKEEKKKD